MAAPSKQPATREWRFREPRVRSSGNISGSSLEGSNTDIASEFTKLIVTQQAYSANTKVITTANTMVQDLLNVLR